ncbi:MAG TPA: DEAD/DEAH box helicase, partial [Pseudomonadales bacterium]|nr:DEAD/DEAH box helicase [Pseudomonadales bacterium]
MAVDNNQHPIEDLPADFAELHLPDELNRAIKKLKFKHCTPIQKEVLPFSLDGRDIIAQAQTGTGKTAAFLIAVIAYHLENPEVESRGNGTPFALAIAPTRELAMQIASDAEKLGEFTDLAIVTLVGGIDYEKQRKLLAQPVDIVVATPGRLLDFCRSRDVDLSQVETLILDEADRMLSMGFIPDVKAIIRRTPRKERRQTQLFSATLSDDIRRLAAQWTLEP